MQTQQELPVTSERKAQLLAVAGIKPDGKAQPPADNVSDARRKELLSHVHK